MPDVSAAKPSSLHSVKSVSTHDSTGTAYTHRVEAELLGVTPRAARQTGKISATLLLLWSFAFLVIGLIAIFWRQDYDTWNALITRGIQTEATVYRKYETSGRSSSCVLDYRFHTQHGTIRGSETVSFAIYNATNPGDTIPVTYLPESNITKWQGGDVSPERRDKQGWTWFWWTAAITGLLGFGLRTIQVNIARQLRFLRTGIPTWGVVTSGKIFSGTYTTCRLFYSYQVGETWFNATADVSANRYRSMTTSNPYFTVLYNPAKPGASMPYFNIAAACINWYL